MAYRNLNLQSNFQLATFGQNGFKKLASGGSLTDANESYIAIHALEDITLTVTAAKGNGLTSEDIPAGDTIYGLFSNVSISAGRCICYIA
jgi:hypothetical protein